MSNKLFLFSRDIYRNKYDRSGNAMIGLNFQHLNPQLEVSDSVMDERM